MTAQPPTSTTPSGTPSEALNENDPAVLTPDAAATTSIIVPAYNEELAIGATLTNLRRAFPAAEVLVVDDGSTDRTAALAAAVSGVRVVRHDQNRGYGAALKTGVLAVSRPYILFCDGDGQHAAEDVAALLRACPEYDLVVGARTRTSHVDNSRRPGKKILQVFADFLAQQKIPDVNSGLRIFRRERLLRYLHLMPEGFSFSTTSTFVALKGGWRIHWVPIEVRKRAGVSTVRQLVHGPQTLMLMLRLTVLFDPLRVFLPVSGLLLVLAMLMTGINFAFFRLAVPTTAVIFGLSGIMIFMMALLVDQVAAIRRELHDRF